MTDVIEERLRAAADRAMTGVELAPPADDDRATPPRRHRWWVTAAAGIAAAVVLGVVMWAAALRDPRPAEPVQPAPHAPAQVRARAAVEATLAAPRWRAEVSGGVAPYEIRFHEPDRAGSVNDSEDERVQSIQVGDTIYFQDDGEWAQSGITERPLTLISDHLALLQGILADGPCFADQGDLIVAWQDPETGCGSSTTELPDDLPPGSDIWVLRITEGRVGDFAVGEVPGEVGSERQGPTSMPPSLEKISVPIFEAGATTAVAYRFGYDDVPPITAPDRAAADTTSSGSVPAGPTNSGTPRNGDLRPIDLVNALGENVADCCEVTDDGIRFTWSGGAIGTLRIDGTDAADPADPRDGMENPQYVTDEAGTFLSDGELARFDCGTSRYSLTVAGGPSAAEVVVTVSAAAGCDRVSIAAPTRCLAQLTDPAACVEPNS